VPEPSRTRRPAAGWPRAVATALLRTVSLYAFFAWVYVAAVAVVHPGDLPTAIVFGIRHDTFGAASLAVSVAAFLASLLSGPRRPPAEYVSVLLRNGGLYATAAWIYIAANSISHPATLHLRLTHFAPWPTEAQFGVACIGVAAACHVSRQLLCGPTPADEDV
jgi:hypothetical protein